MPYILCRDTCSVQQKAFQCCVEEYLQCTIYCPSLLCREVPEVNNELPSVLHRGVPALYNRLPFVLFRGVPEVYCQLTSLLFKFVPLI